MQFKTWPKHPSWPRSYLGCGPNFYNELGAIWDVAKTGAFETQPNYKLYTVSD